MIKFKYKEESFYCPTSWNEIKFGQWKSMQNLTNDKDLISAITGMDLEIVNMLSDKSLFNLSNAMSFIKNPIDYDNLETSKFVMVGDVKVETIEDIKTESYGQKINAQHCISENSSDEMNIISEVFLTYSQPQIDGDDFKLDRINSLKPLLDDVFFVALYSVVISYSNQIKDILELEKTELSIEPTLEQKTAGVEMFAKFGVMNTIKALANNNILNYEKVLRMEYNTVFVHLLMNKTEGIYQDNYKNVLEQKRKQKRR